MQQALQTPVWMMVEMEVTRYQEFEEDGLVQVFGYVGDYEVSCHLPLNDARVQTLRRQAPPAVKRDQKRRP